MIPGSEWTCGIDEIAVRRAMAGTVPRPKLDAREQRYAAQLMTEDERPGSEIAAAVGVSVKAVDRWWAASRAAS